MRAASFILSYGGAAPNSAQELAQLKKLGLKGFADSSDTQLKPIRQLELFKDKSKLEADTGMDPAEKKVKLEELTRKLNDLAKA